MNSSSSNATKSGKNGSVFPKEKEHVSTKVGKKIAETGKKVVESAVDAVKKHNGKGKISLGDPIDGVHVENDLNEPTMGEKLASLNLTEKSEIKSHENVESSPQTKPPSADSVHILLKQALRADDRALLIDCLFRQDEKFVKIIGYCAFVSLFDRGAVLACALPWLRSLLLQDAGEIMSQESSLVALNSLYQTNRLHHSDHGCLRTLNRDQATAARYDDIDDVISIASAGVSLDSKDPQGRTALHMAAANGHLDIIEYLLCNGADINASNVEKNTPLHWACLNGHIEVVKHLILAGANVSLLNSHERTPMDEAISRGKMDMIDAVNEAVAQVELSGTRVS
ncbi:GA-binding protein subunit beta-2 like [Abeliophyllum distichum]|uniref:GA-binding protein subunit beta-2 like n=1 Tax=Abeliophyllum distichum TaxID=126358 RepID=A0ABD1NX67_9LAMI